MTFFVLSLTPDGAEIPPKKEKGKYQDMIEENLASVCRCQIERQRLRCGKRREKKNSFIALPGKGGLQQANASKTVPSPSPWEGLREVL